MKIALLTSYPMDICIGSGVVQTIRQYNIALGKLGHTCQIFSPPVNTALSEDLTALRMDYNKELAKEEYSDFDFIVGNDFDGYLLPEKYMDRYFVINGGVLADIIRFESGKAAEVLKIQAGLEKINTARARKIIVPSRYAAGQVQNHYNISGNRVVIIAPGVNSVRWQPGDGGEKSRKGTGIICVARQYPRKGIRDLLTAFRILSASYPQLRLDLVGRGPQFSENKRLASDWGLAERIRILGDVRDRDRLLSLFRQNDIFCLPSYHETFGLVYLEAMACGLPVVAYRTTAVPEAVPENCGVLCPPGSIDGLAKAMERLILNPEERNKLGRNGVRFSRSLSWDQSAAALIDTLQSTKGN